MRKITYIAFILFCFCFSKAQAQDGWTVGAGLGPNFYFGSISRVNRVGFSTYLDGKYKFKDMYAVGLSYGYNSLGASRYADLDGAYRETNTFESSAHAFDLHLQIELIESFHKITKKKNQSKFKAYFDIGAGFVFYNEIAYRYSMLTEGLVIDYIHNEGAPHGNGQVGKYHFGGEVDYEVTKEIDIFASFIGHQCLNSKIDGYSTYWNGEPAENDFYYTLALGARYNLPSSSGSMGSSRMPGPKQAARKKKKKTRVLINKTYRFDRFQGRKSAKKYKYKQSTKLDVERYSGRKGKKESWFKRLFKKKK